MKGVWYYPKEDYSYKEIGVASWYGPDFHNGVTANGELYNMHEMTAAHRTLPLPSMVRVTNLQNGRSVVLRVNDRGPYEKNRVIDVSMRAAQMLGFKDEGTAQVQVEILAEESKKLKEEMLASAQAAKENYPQESLAQPRNLTYANYPKLANPPPATAGTGAAPLIGDSVKEKENPYNDWDDDLSKAQAQKSVVETPAPVVKKETPKPEAPKTKAPAAQPRKSAAPVASGAVAPGFYVQVGAFGSMDNARNMRDSVSRFGPTVIHPMTTGSGKTLYRVRLGPTDMKKAVEIMDKLSESNISDARVVEEKGSVPAGKRLDEAF